MLPLRKSIIPADAAIELAVVLMLIAVAAVSAFSAMG